jgi:murein DD-endopeptidase MepM/ murein hydrolase activator NlpD
MAPPYTAPRNLLFPFKLKPSLSWHDGHRYFGAPRPKGRLHAGCDLIFPVGTPIFAMADGFIMRQPWLFYEHTDVLEVCHPQQG